MTVETITRLRCDRCQTIEEYESEKDVATYSYRFSLTAGPDLPYMPRSVDICKLCALELVHSWFRRPPRSPAPTEGGE